ncbi:MAG: NERD domain-containing protein [Arenicella sp.]|nr:NERD domain-containing protein [Arenicella sp.]
MAELYPSSEEISLLKIQPTEGQMYLLTYLAANLSDENEIYYKPILNGDQFDVVVLKKGCGVAIIEVRDWDLKLYVAEKLNEWRNIETNQVFKSPTAQLQTYKGNIFNLHISGLAEKAVLNDNFYKVVHPFVFFYGPDKKAVGKMFECLESNIHQEKKELTSAYKGAQLNYTFL